MIPAAFEARGVRRVVHFHADHFEPFRKDLSGTVIGLQHVKHWTAERFKRSYAAHASLFMSSQFLTRVPPGAEDRQSKPVLRSHPGDKIAFVEHSNAHEEAILLSFLGAIAADLHVHIHHEFWCSGPVLKIPADPEGDAVRLDWFLGPLLSHLRRSSGLALRTWAFVHGCWSLNAADKSICQITREVEILAKHGCVADLSFPSGRPWCDPTHKAPYTFIPSDIERCYDVPQADIRPLTEGHNGWSLAGPAGEQVQAQERARARFLIWSTPAEAYQKLSLDMVADGSGGSPTTAVHAWVTLCPVIDGTLYIKTHAHSLWWERWQSSNDTTTPLLSAPVAQAFGLLEDGCRAANVELEFKTVRQALTGLGAQR